MSRRNIRRRKIEKHYPTWVSRHVDQSVEFADLIAKLLRVLRDRKTLFPDRAEINIEDWLNCYACHRSVEAEVFYKAIEISEVEVSDADYIELLDFFWILRSPKAHLKGFDWSSFTEDDRKEGQRLIELAIRIMSSESWRTEFEDEERSYAFVSNPSIRFYLEVSIPCWVLYGEPVQVVYRRARKGKPKDIQNLFRLDKRIIHDRYIRNHFVEAAYCNKKRYDQFLMALRLPIKYRDEKKMKEFMIAQTDRLLDAYHERTGRLSQQFPDRVDTVPKANVQDIAEVFHASVPEGIDPDLDIAENTIYRAAQRAKSAWPKYS